MKHFLTLLLASSLAKAALAAELKPKPWR